MQQRPVEALIGVRIRRDLCHAGGGHRRIQQGRVVAGAGAIAVAVAVVEGRLLRVAGEVRLDVDDRRVAVARDGVIGAGAEALHQQREIGVIGGHRGRVVEVGEVFLHLAAAGAGTIALIHLVVGEDGNIAVCMGCSRVPERELPALVPAFPAAAGVDPRREVLVGVVPGDPRIGQPAIEIGRSRLRRETDTEVGGQRGDGAHLARAAQRRPADTG